MILYIPSPHVWRRVRPDPDLGQSRQQGDHELGEDGEAAAKIEVFQSQGIYVTFERRERCVV